MVEGVERDRALPVSARAGAAIGVAPTLCRSGCLPHRHVDLSEYSCISVDTCSASKSSDIKCMSVTIVLGTEC